MLAWENAHDYIIFAGALHYDYYIFRRNFCCFFLVWTRLSTNFEMVHLKMRKTLFGRVLLSFMLA